jgi:regulator of replication initiation timing
MFVFSVLTFMAALYYVEQQVQLRTLNYEIIELKQQKNLLLEQRKTLQLELDQSKQLDKIEEDMRKRGFVPVAEDQIRVVQ